MNPTAVLHGGFGLMVLIGFLVSEPTLRIGAFGLGVILFIAGIVVARRDDE